MTNAAANNRQLALEWIDAFNLQALDKILSLYAHDAIHYSPKLKALQPETGGWIKGKPALSAWWKDAFTRLPGLKYILVNMLADERIVFIEYRRELPGEPSMLVAEVFEISNNLIVKSKVYHS